VDLIAVDLLAAFDVAKHAANALNWLWVAIGLGFVIFFHELGHFAVAKWCGVFVERFSIGFGPILWSFKIGDTEYALSAIPFGGYVKMLGQDDIDPSQLSSEEIAQDPRSYSAKPVWQRMAIISAGVIMNIITGLLFFAIAFRGGVETKPARIGGVRVGNPAWKAGLRAGDRITKINGRDASEYVDIMVGVALTSDDVELEGITEAGQETFRKTLKPDSSETRRLIGVIANKDTRLVPMLSADGPVTYPGTPAAETGAFRKGDRIVKVGDTPVKSFPELQDQLIARRHETLDFVVERPAKPAKPGEDAPPAELVTISVGPNRFRRLGLSMEIEKIVAIQDGSPAAEAGLRPGDKIVEVDGQAVGHVLNPVELGDYFQAHHGQPVKVVVTREGKEGTKEQPAVEITPLDRSGWVDQSNYATSPLSVPSIGVAFQITNQVLKVEPGSPAEGKIAPNERITAVELFLPAGAAPDGFGDKQNKLKKFEGSSGPEATIWAQAYWMLQLAATRHARLTVSSAGKSREVELVPMRDPNGTSFFPDRGFILRDEGIVRKADSLGEALSMATHHSSSKMLEVYLTLRSLFRGDLSFKELHGPIGIASVAHEVVSQGLSPMLLFLGFLSINLAVLNFLPIPVLDGGHMVFLCWEAVTRKRPSEKVLIGATYCGMAFVLGLMVLVIYLDIFVHGGGPK
jgi:regulator of sigma E protease